MCDRVRFVLKRTNLYITGVIFFTVAAVVVVLAVTGSSAFLNQMPPANQSCSSTHLASHKVIIKNDQAEPSTTKASLCDTLNITNLDDSERLIAFGPHEDHVAYNGVSARLLSKDQSFTITLNKAGTYRFHDHIHDNAVGYFIVAK